MTPATLRALALEAAARRQWIKAADLKSQADDLERAELFGRDPYRVTFTHDQRAEAERMLAGCDTLTLETP